MAESFDVVVIGSGPGGYAAAIRSAQRGASVGLVEKADIGGTCLNRGCIPSKTLLSSAHLLTIAKNAEQMGVDISSAKPNWPRIQSRKDAIVAGLGKGLTGLLQSNKIKIFQGRGTVKTPGLVQVESESGKAEIAAKSIILATGSAPIEMPEFPFDGKIIINSTEALNLSEIPQSMVIIGGGAIGCELACVYAVMGCEVTIIEMLLQLLPGQDPWVGGILAKEFKKLGIESLTGQKVSTVDVINDTARVTLQTGQSIEAEKVLVAVGRRGTCDKETIDALGLEMAGATIAVNEKMETNVPGVYAIGDVVGTTYLAHGAFAEADVAAANATGDNKTIGDYNLVPMVVYTFPEVASVGKNETECERTGIETVVGKALFRFNGRSVVNNETIGEVRVVRNKANNEIMGITIVGASATELIATARAHIGSTEEITDVSFAHPTVSEVLKEAWEDAFGISLHTPRRT